MNVNHRGFFVIMWFYRTLNYFLNPLGVDWFLYCRFCGGVIPLDVEAFKRHREWCNKETNIERRKK